MLKRYEVGDILSVPVAENKVAPVQVVAKMGGNVLVAVFSDLLEGENPSGAESLELDHPIFLVETMDLRITDGSWWKIGHRTVSPSIAIPQYKVWVEPPGEYRIQDIHGNVSIPISAERASGIKSQKSFSPAVIEAALRGFHEYGPWNAAFDEFTA